MSEKHKKARLGITKGAALVRCELARDEEGAIRFTNKYTHTMTFITSERVRVVDGFTETVIESATLSSSLGEALNEVLGTDISITNRGFLDPRLSEGIDLLKMAENKINEIQKSYPELIKRKENPYGLTDLDMVQIKR